MSAAGSSARSAVSSSVSVEAGRRARPPLSCSSRSRVLTRLPLWPMASARRGPSRYVGWAFSQIVEPGRRIAAMGDRQLAAQARQPALVEDRADHPEVLVEHQLLAVADRQPGRFLAAVLEREQAERGDRRGLGRLADPAGRPRTRRTSASALPAEGAGEPVVPGVAEVAERDLERVGDAAAAVLARRPSPAAPSSITRRSPPTEPIVSTGRPCWRASSSSAAA